MGYLFAAYSITWLVIAGYIWFIGKRQKDAVKELKFLRDLSEEE